MIGLIKIICVAIIAVILISIIKMYKPEYAIEITICASIILLYFVVEGIGYSINYINGIYNKLSYGKSYFPIILKVLVIAYITEFSVALCNDAGEKSIASKVELAGKIAIFFASIPVFDSLMSLLNNLI